MIAVRVVVYKCQAKPDCKCTQRYAFAAHFLLLIYKETVIYFSPLNISEMGTDVDFANVPV